MLTTKLCTMNMNALIYKNYRTALLSQLVPGEAQMEPLVGGVGTLVSKSAEIRSVNKRILVVMFSGNAMTTIIVNYAPTEGSDDAGAHYETLSSTVNATLKHHVVIECGNFNANFGSDKVRHTYHNTTNENGKLLLEHATECNLHITNTMFEKWKGKFWTFISDMN